MTQAQKNKLSWMLADLCASSVRLGRVKNPRSHIWSERGEEQDRMFDRVMLYVDEIVN